MRLAESTENKHSKLLSVNDDNNNNNIQIQHSPQNQLLIPPTNNNDQIKSSQPLTPKIPIFFKQISIYNTIFMTILTISIFTTFLYALSLTLITQHLYIYVNGTEKVDHQVISATGYYRIKVLWDNKAKSIAVINVTGMIVFPSIQLLIWLSSLYLPIKPSIRQKLLNIACNLGRGTIILLLSLIIVGTGSYGDTVYHVDKNITIDHKSYQKFEVGVTTLIFTGTIDVLFSLYIQQLHQSIYMRFKGKIESYTNWKHKILFLDNYIYIICIPILLFSSLYLTLYSQQIAIATQQSVGYYAQELEFFAHKVDIKLWETYHDLYSHTEGEPFTKRSLSILFCAAIIEMPILSNLLMIIVWFIPFKDKWLRKLFVDTVLFFSQVCSAWIMAVILFIAASEELQKMSEYEFEQQSGEICQFVIESGESACFGGSISLKPEFAYLVVAVLLNIVCLIVTRVAIIRSVKI